ncbi:MAG: hypothetical protein ACKO8T_08325, partial [Actinomycetota bacterium]
GAWQWISTGGAHNNYDGVTGLAIKSDGTIVTSAIYQEYGTPSYGAFTLAPTNHDRDIALLKLDSSGSWISADRIGTVADGWSGTEDAIDIDVLPNGKTALLANFTSTNLVVANSTVSTTGGFDILVAVR